MPCAIARGARVSAGQVREKGTRQKEKERRGKESEERQRESERSQGIHRVHNVTGYLGAKRVGTYTHTRQHRLLAVHFPFRSPSVTDLFLLCPTTFVVVPAPFLDRPRCRARSGSSDGSDDRAGTCASYVSLANVKPWW